MLQYEEICGWGSSNALKYLWWGRYCERTYRECFNASRTVILTSKTGIAVEERRFSKMQNWRHYLSKTRVKIKKNWHDHWEWLNKPFQNASKPWEFRSKEIGRRTNWSRNVERCLFACEQLLERQRRKGFLHRIVTGDKKWGRKNHYDNSKRRKSWGVSGQMLPRRRPNRIFTAPRSYSVFGGTNSAQCIMNC